jgi:hypothetical protein
MTVQPLSEIKDRRDFAEAFGTAMAGAVQTLRSISKFGREQNLPKSYLVEFHPKHNGHLPQPWTTEALFETLSNDQGAFGSVVRRTKDDSLLYLSHDEGANSAEFIIDSLNPRFLVFHTLSNAKATDRFVFNRLTQYHQEFDLFWLPVSLLESVEQRERVTGWEAAFEPLLDESKFERQDDDHDVGEIDEELREELVELEEELPSMTPSHTRLRINILRPNAMNTYWQVKQKPSVFPDVPLSSVLAERFDDELSTQARARIKWNGKITGRGTDFLAYSQIVNGTLDSYASAVTSLESQYSLGLTPCQEGHLGFGLKGEPFWVTFESPINVESVVYGMFNCVPPFRLMGEPEKLGDDYYVIDAVDLHVGQPLAIEVSPNLMRIYLYEGTCGNTIVRILRSLQHFVDSNLSHSDLGSEQTAWH